MILACNCPIPFLAQNDGERIGNLNYSWRQVSILCMRGMENNVIVIKKNSYVSTCVFLTLFIT